MGSARLIRTRSGTQKMTTSKFGEDLLHQPVKRHSSVENKPCVLCGRPHVLLRHGADSRSVLHRDGLRSASAFVDIAGQPASEANVVRRIHVDGEIVKGEKAVVVKRE